ncbi:MAG: hypothetical protein ACT4PE_11745 [Candidatus Eiseniibacteriota bacterium]
MHHGSYYDLSRPSDRKESTTYFVLDSLLRSRIECGFESDPDRHDESVNVYLVHLLASLVGAPGRGELTATRDVDVFEKVRHVSDPRFKCEVYRANADHLLVSTGIFGDTPYADRDGRRVYDGAAQERIGRGKAYYHYAAAFHERTAAASPAVGDVLCRLSQDFERFVDVLFHMRGEYFHLYQRFREQTFAALTAGPAAEIAASDVRMLRDDFLDAYWRWHVNPEPETRAVLEESVQRLRAADPSFDFKLPE